MTDADIEAIVGGYHGDAFRILGPHGAGKKAGGAKWEVRAFLPQAETAEVDLGGRRFPMLKRQAQGFFSATLDGGPRPYRLRARLWDASEVEIEDPYRFGPQISDADLHLHGEGTLFEAYR